jgi:DNA-binding HxlR family transcriptional regulator
MGQNGTSHGERDRCPLYTAISAIQGRWKPMIFRRLGEGPLGFGELQRTMPGVTIKVLRQQLRELEAEGLVACRGEFVSMPAPGGGHPSTSN